MNLGDNKKITLGLIEEYSPNSQYLTDDEDIRNRLNLVYFPSYQYLSEKKPIVKTKTITITENDNSSAESFLPMDLRQFVRIVGFDNKNNRISPSYDIIGKKIFIKKMIGKYIIEYHAFPSEINSDTDDNFELEIDQDVQAILPYMVANDILKTDPSANYSAFYNEYRKKIEEFDSRMILKSAVVSGGYDI